jgi:hypothetical protein
MTDVTEERQSELRMAFNEALAGGPNMNGDCGPIIHTEGHAHDLQLATDCINELRERGQKLAEMLAALRRECGGGKLGPNQGLTVNISGHTLYRTAKALAEWEAGK